jgi:hypothetical protein
MQMYLEMFHGFKNEEEREKAQCWGEHGPNIGPLQYVHTTYASNVKYKFVNDIDAVKFDIEPEGDIDVTKDGCLLFNGMEYGDWSCYIE